jgi:hypothetical protein
MQSRIRWATAIIGIAIVGIMVMGNVPSTHFVGGAGASPVTPVATRTLAGAPTASVAPQAATPHTSQGPHPGTLEIYESSSGGPQTIDPAVCYYTVCDEPISNVYQTLIAYNGTQAGPTPSSYVPQLAVCVPGSNECSGDFAGNDLVYDNNTTGAPQYYTFEIDAGARFYDHSNNVGWAVYPSDVLFSFARTMGWADLAYEEETNGWINTQDLVPVGQVGFDGGMHYPLNNTPEHILDSFIVNNSYYCPSSPSIPTNGCITFNVGASGQSWPYFLELVADNLGGSIVPCGWYTAQGAGVPGFAGTNASNGDGPCLLPGNSITTQQTGYQNYVASVTPEGWDNFENQALDWPANAPSVQWNDVGSGPYYVVNPVQPTLGYTMGVNPDYSAPIGCAGQPGCMPLPGTYIPNVDVTWESPTVGDTTGLNEMAAGQADSAGFFTTDLSQVQTYTSYKLITNVASLTIGFFPFALTYNLTNEKSEDTSGQSPNVPDTFFQNDALRNFLVNAFPYSTIDQTFNTVNGITFGEDYGGAIPHGMGPYYPMNITWPGGNPISNPTQVGNVTWWWAQANNPSSSLYDPDLAACTSSAPCKYSTFSVSGDTALDAIETDWDNSVATLSGGNLTPYVVDVSGQVLDGNLGSAAGQMPMPTYDFGWAPDYPDPSDYMAPMYYPANSYTNPDAVSQTMALPANNATTCPDNYGAWSNLTYWAGIPAIPTDCQGAAYDTMVAFMDLAQFNAHVPQRILEYNLVEQIANKLALYVYNPQDVVAVDYGTWIQPSTINTNVVYGGGGVQLWYNWNYAANYFTATFNEAGLPVSSDWTVTVDGVPYSSDNTSAVTVPNLVDGEYSYTVSSIAGYTVNPVSGTFNITAANATTVITFTPFSGPQYTLSFQESGLRAGTTWNVVVTGASGGGLATGNTSTISTVLPGADYNYTPRPVTGYNTPAPGSVDLNANLTVNVTFENETHSGYLVQFTETNLPTGSSWSVTINATTLKGTTATLSVTLQNGTYSWGVTSLPGGYSASPTAGTVTVAGAAVNQPITTTAAQTVTTSSTPWTYLSTLAWVLIGILALLVIIFLALALMAGRRPPSSPPESWSSSSSTTTTDSKGNQGGSS